MKNRHRLTRAAPRRPLAVSGGEMPSPSGRRGEAKAHHPGAASWRTSKTRAFPGGSRWRITLLGVAASACCAHEQTRQVGFQHDGVGEHERRARHLGSPVCSARPVSSGNGRRDSRRVDRQHAGVVGIPANSVDRGRERGTTRIQKQVGSPCPRKPRASARQAGCRGRDHGIWSDSAERGEAGRGGSSRKNCVN